VLPLGSILKSLIPLLCQASNVIEPIPSVGILKKSHHMTCSLHWEKLSPSHTMWMQTCTMTSLPKDLSLASCTLPPRIPLIDTPRSRQLWRQQTCAFDLHHSLVDPMSHKQNNLVRFITAAAQVCAYPVQNLVFVNSSRMQHIII